MYMGEIINIFMKTQTEENILNYYDIYYKYHFRKILPYMNIFEFI